MKGRCCQGVGTLKTLARTTLNIGSQSGQFSPSAPSVYLIYFGNSSFSLSLFLVIILVLQNPNGGLCYYPNDIYVTHLGDIKVTIQASKILGLSSLLRIPYLQEALEDALPVKF